MFTIKKAKPVLCALMLTSAFVVGLAQAKASDEGVISKTSDTEGSYCHLTFPAIRPETLGTNHPQLKSAAEGDIIDFYGSCDHDPLGKDEVESQEHDQLIRGLRNYGGD
jgi:hypothetical protein